MIIAALCFHIYTRIYYSPGENAILIPLVIFLVPLILATIIYLIRKKGFHYSYWVCSTLLIVLFNIFLFFAFLRPAVKLRGPNGHDVTNYFRAKGGLFTRCYFLYSSYEYPEAYYPKAYIAKTVYRTGGPRSKQIFIGKVLIDLNGKVIKEFFDQPASHDPALLKSEFGKSLEDLD